MLVGDGEPLAAALRQALDRRQMLVESAAAADVVRAATVAAPDLLVLVGDAVADEGRAALAALAADPVTSLVPVALIKPDATLDQRLRAFRSGAVAVIPRSASVDAMARRLKSLCHELPNRPGEAKGALGESTLDELVHLVSQQLRSGILSVERTDGSKDDAPIRLVLGPGERVASALDQFVDHLKALIAEAEPLQYELFETAGGRLRLLDDIAGAGAGLEVFDGLRVLVMDDDPGRADGLAAALREQGALVAVTDLSVRGLERAHRIDPTVVFLDATAIEGRGFEAIRSMRRDPRLRWASLLVLDWEEVWIPTAASPDLESLADKVEPIIAADAELTARAATNEAFDTRLELTGPSRLLRALVGVPGTRHLTVRSADTMLELDLADGLVVSASGKTKEGRIDGLDALSRMASLASARVHVETRMHPREANVMMPVDEALDGVTPKLLSIAPSSPPPPLVAAEETEDDGSGPLFARPDRAAKRSGPVSQGAATVDELAWSGSESTTPTPRAASAGMDPDRRARGQNSKPKAIPPPSRAVVMTQERTRSPTAQAADSLAASSEGSLSEDASSKGASIDELASEETVSDTADTLDAVGADRRTPASRTLRQRTQLGLGGPPSDSTYDPFNDPEEVTAAGDSLALAAAKITPDAATRGAALAKEIHDAPTMRPPSDDAMMLDAQLEETSLAQPRLPEGSDLFGRGLPTPLVPPPDVANSAASIPRAATDDTELFRRPQRRGRWAVTLAMVLSVLGVGYVALWRFAPQRLPTWAGGHPGAAAVVGPDDAADNGIDAHAAAKGAPSPASPARDVSQITERDDPPDEEDSSEPTLAAIDVGVEGHSDEDPMAPAAAGDAAFDEDQAEHDPAEDIEAMSARERDRKSDEHAALAERFANEGQLAQAQRHASHALRLAERNPQALAARARVHLAAGQGPAAVEWATKAARMRSRRAAYQVLLGDARKLAGDLAGARRSWRRALEMEPDNRQAQARLR